MKICMINNCDKKVLARDWCSKHYSRWKVHGDPLKTTRMIICTIKKCNLDHQAKGFCKIHYRKFLRYGHPLGVRILKRGILPCIAKNCDDKYYTKGYCKLHYDRVLLNGKTELDKRIYITNPEKRFHCSYKINIKSKCWEWTKPLNIGGYGEIWVNKKKISSHRYSYLLHNRKLPKNKLICHKCGNAKCVNPQHLYAGTAKDNIRDAMEMKRIALGENSYGAKLTNKQVKEIKIQILNGARNCDLAKKYCVHKSCIAGIKSGVIWKSIGV